MINFVLDKLDTPLRQSGFRIAVKVVRYRILQSNFHFSVMLELYNLDSCTFFTPVGELGFALHEMHEVSGLSMGEIPYEEYIPSLEELHILKRDVLQVYDTYWGVLCHFYICGDLTGYRSGGVKQLSWASYLFPGVDDKTASPSRRDANTAEEILAMRGTTEDTCNLGYRSSYFVFLLAPTNLEHLCQYHSKE